MNKWQELMNLKFEVQITHQFEMQDFKLKYETATV